MLPVTMLRGLIYFSRSNRFSRRLIGVVLAGDCNIILDLDIDHIGTRSRTNNLDVKPFRNSFDNFDIVDRYPNEQSDSADMDE